MRKEMERAGSVLLVALCVGIYCGYQSNGNIGEKQEIASVLLLGEELVPDQQETEEETQAFSVEEERKIIESTWANSHRSRIDYMDGYYYYASQSDHYYLYRVKEDGSEPQCMAKIHPGSICARDGYVYFINQSDSHGIYRIKADGTGMEKLCEDGHDLQIGDEYLFFCSSSYEETLETTGIIVEGQKNGGLYRMKKDGSERELIAEDVWDYLLSDGYSQETQNMEVIYYSKTEGNGMTAYQMDINGQGEEELCHFAVRGNLAVFGGDLYCIGAFYGDREKLTRFCLKNREESSFSVPEYWDCCIYRGFFYGLCVKQEEQQIKWNIYRLDLDSGDSEMLYEDTFQWESGNDGNLSSDLYATENGVFFRRFVSVEEGNRWFRLTDDGEVREFEDREKIPVTLSAEYVDYADLLSVTRVLDEMSTEGYEAYLSDDLKYEEYFSENNEGEPSNPFRICLPQFNSKIAGYQQINSYIQNVLYQEALQEKDDFVEELEIDNFPGSYFRNKSYDYVYIGEDYITVGLYGGGYTGGVRGWEDFEPITFDRASGKVVSLGDILGMTTQEAVARLTGSVYKYKEGKGNGSLFLQEGNLLTNKFDPENFLLFPRGIGIYYPRYAIECGAAGDFLYIIPWEDAVSTP